MFNIVLRQPEIPPNTGNIIRLCSNTGAHLHLIRPLGFHMTEAHLKRAGLDYRETAHIRYYDSDEAFFDLVDSTVFLCSTKGKMGYSDVNFQRNNFLIFGSETKGLPEDLIDKYQKENRVIKIPMLKNQRSLNLSNSVAIILYEALRQNNFTNLLV